MLGLHPQVPFKRTEYGAMHEEQTPEFFKQLLQLVVQGRQVFFPLLKNPAVQFISASHFKVFMLKKLPDWQTQEPLTANVERGGHTTHFPEYLAQKLQFAGQLLQLYPSK